MKLTIATNNSSQRIDKFLKKEVFFNEEISRGEIIRQIKSGNILVNGKKIRPSYILKENDKIELNLQNKSEKIIPNRKIKIKIIFQDENIIAINKPAGLQVHPDNNEKLNTVSNFLILKFPEMREVGEDPMRPGIVHRLDKDTSGVMIAAKNQKTFEELKSLFKNRKIEKKYLALVYGKMENKKGIIKKPIARSSDYRKQIIAGKKTKTKIRPAVTEYKVIKEFPEYSLLEIKPRTGRMHQIRVHMNSIGHPILGDKLYKRRNIKHNLSAKRQMLHAKGLNLELFEKKYFLEAGLPNDFKTFLNRVD